MGWSPFMVRTSGILEDYVTEVLSRYLRDILCVQCNPGQPHMSHATPAPFRVPGKREWGATTSHVKAGTLLCTGLMCTFHQSLGTTLSPPLEKVSCLLLRSDHYLQSLSNICFLFFFFDLLECLHGLLLSFLALSN